MSTTETESVEDAQALCEALEERIKDGDETVSAEELERAHGLLRFARLRTEAQRRKAAKAEQERLAKAVAELTAEARELSPHAARRKAQEKAGADVQKALAKLRTALEASDAEVSSLAARIGSEVGDGAPDELQVDHVGRVMVGGVPVASRLHPTDIRRQLEQVLKDAQKGLR